MKRKTPQKDVSPKDNKNEEAVKMTTVSKIVNFFILLLLKAIAGYIIFRTVKPLGIILYSWHPTLMAIGYLILMSHGILAMSDKNIFTQGLNYQKRVTTHWVTQAVALVLITIAQSAIYINKERYGYPHYQTTHSLFGLVTYLLTVTATLGGTLTKYSYQLRNVVKPAMLKIGHSFAGITVYMLATATIFLGLNQSWTDYNDLYVKLGILVSFLITSTYVCNKSFKSATSRISELTQKPKK